MNALTLTAPTAALVGTSMGEAMQLASMMADSKLVPAHLQGRPADCLMVVMQASRWRMDPFAVAQATNLVQGKLGYEGKLVAAAVHTSGVLMGRLAFDYTGEGERRTVHVTGTLRGEAEPRSVSVVYASAKTTNQHWAKSPDQMLAYHGARVWARRHAPEVMLGVYAPEEFDEPAAPPATGERIVGLAVPEQPAIAAPVPHSIRDRIDAFADQLAGIAERGDPDEFRHWLGLPGTQKALAWLRDPPAVTLSRYGEGAREVIAQAERQVSTQIEALRAALFPEEREREPGEDEPEGEAP
jgi:hypothetical protein